MTDVAVSSSLIEDCYTLLAKTNSNVVWEILRQSDAFLEWNHYPKGDVFDKETHAQYYYHAHPPNLETRWVEHGHFHLFIRTAGIPSEYQPKVLSPFQQEGKNDALCHIGAISMDKFGRPIRLFTTNRWVTGETWYAAEVIEQFIDRFAITHTWPSWPTNIWLTQFVHEHRNQLIDLLYQREKTLDNWQNKHPDINAYEDRRLEITSVLELN